MPNIEIIDTDAMAWEAWYPEFQGTKCKTLFEEPDTKASLRLAYVPTGFTLPGHTRHHHGPGREFVFVLFGDLPYVEYETPQSDPRGFTFRKGMLLDRPPMSIHGMSTDPVTSLGSLLLEWADGPNTFYPVPFEGKFADEGPFAAPSVVDSATVAWREHRSIPAWSVRTLSSGEPTPKPDYHPVTIVHLPTSWKPSAGESSLELDGEGRPWMYVLSGSASIQIIDADGESCDVDLREGTWVRWSSGARVHFAEQWTTDIGLTLLCAGNEFV